RHTRRSGDWSSDVCSSDLGGKPRVVRVRGTNGGRFRLVRRSAREIAQVHAESRCRPRASECLPNFVVTPAQRDRAGDARRIGGEGRKSVVEGRRATGTTGG